MTHALHAYGIAIQVPHSWDARIFKHPNGEPTLHAANFALPHNDGEFGTNATAQMSGDSVFFALTEYRPDAKLEAGKGLFAAAQPRKLDPADFSERSLLRAHRGHVGLQRFFTASHRPFCLYIVIGSNVHTARLAKEATECLRALFITPNVR